MSGDTREHATAHAKLNLSLRVLAREATGYHQIETVFCALELADDIEISRTRSGVTLEVATPADEPGNVPDLGPPDRNLAVRAAAAFADAAGLNHGVHIRLVKRIPAGAGLGGGSSDAATVLRALNRMQKKPLPRHTMLTLGASLGSDVPFFMTEAALALAWGRGERMMPLAPLDPAPIVLLVPPERVSTAEAYAALDSQRAMTPAALQPPRTWSDIALHATNDFEEIIFARHPRLGELRQLLEEAGAHIARMTGTGSVVFGVFDDAATARAAARRAGSAHPDVQAILTQTRSA
ncbi:MAG TPA: 4-(cytidine 5'-diphospho)-2-C-methyl-D-erythritol kinase [Longimicrobiales bacterium]|nr:4-(cytidine 5'-diphospho)-2-C-methyl-D-erythritol kinase [Longimicrobiales bacterium]